MLLTQNGRRHERSLTPVQNCFRRKSVVTNIIKIVYENMPCQKKKKKKNYSAARILFPDCFRKPEKTLNFHIHVLIIFGASDWCFRFGAFVLLTFWFSVV